MTIPGRLTVCGYRIAAVPKPRGAQGGGFGRRPVWMLRQEALVLAMP